MRRPGPSQHSTSSALRRSAPWRASAACNEPAHTATSHGKGSVPSQQCVSARGNRPAGPSTGTCITTLPTGPARVGSACSAAHGMQALCTDGTLDGTLKSNTDKARARVRGACAPAARSWASWGVEADSLPPAHLLWLRCARLATVTAPRRTPTVVSILGVSVSFM